MRYLKTRVSMRELYDVALGEVSADLVVKGGNIISTTSREIFQADVVIKGERIALVGRGDLCIGGSTRVIRARGEYVSPGFMDAHVHVESSIMTLTRYCEAVLPRGTTAIFFDPNETAYVLGEDGVKLMLDEGKSLPLKVFGQAPSRIPSLIAKGLETYGAEFTLDAVLRMLSWEDVTSLAELVYKKFTRSPKYFDLIERARQEGATIEGSAHGLLGQELNAFIAAGIQSDHEAISLQEARERIRLGIRLFIREGTTARNLDLIKVLMNDVLDSRHCCFCTDDKSPKDLLNEGHIDHCIRLAISMGLDPVTAIQMATINTAEYFGFDRELGSVSPGKIADLVIFEDLERIKVKRVLIDGKVVAENGGLLMSLHPVSYPEWSRKTVRLRRPLFPRDFKISYPTDKKKAKCLVIKLIEDQIITEKMVEELPVIDGEIIPDLEKDILKVAVVERYGKSPPNTGLGFIKGFGLKKGAFGLSSSITTHNIILVGVDKRDMALVVNRIAEIQGGIVITQGGQVLDELSLPIGGFLSSEPADKIAEKIGVLRRIVRDELGCALNSPFMALAFQICSGIPKLKITDKGLVDVEAARLVNTIISQEAIN